VRGLSPGKFPVKNQSNCEDGGADQVRGSGDATQISFRIIAPEHFDEGAGERVADQVESKHLPVEFLSPIQPGQGRVKPKAQQRLVDLSGVQVPRKCFVTLRILDGQGTVVSRP